MPFPVLVVDEDVRIQEMNQAALPLFGGDSKETILRKRGGDALHCLEAARTPDGCGRGKECRECVIRNSVGEALRGGHPHRQRARMELVTLTGVALVHVLVTAAPVEFTGHTFALLILEDITELIALRGLIPICSKCKKIRNDQAFWQEVERYFQDRLDAKFTHSICPACSRELLKEEDGGNA